MVSGVVRVTAGAIRTGVSYVGAGTSLAINGSGRFAKVIKPPLDFAVTILGGFIDKEILEGCKHARTVVLCTLTVQSWYTGDMKKRLLLRAKEESVALPSTHPRQPAIRRSRVLPSISFSAEANALRSRFFEGIVWSTSLIIKPLEQLNSKGLIAAGLGRLSVSVATQQWVSQGVVLAAAKAVTPLKCLSGTATVFEFVASAQSWYKMTSEKTRMEKLQTQLRVASATSDLGIVVLGIVVGGQVVAVLAAVSFGLGIATNYVTYRQKKAQDEKSTTDSSKSEPETIEMVPLKRAPGGGVQIIAGRRQWHRHRRPAVKI